jgi:hypothetical protein
MVVGHDPDSDDDAELAERERQLYVQQARLLQHRTTSAVAPGRDSHVQHQGSVGDRGPVKDEVPVIPSFPSQKSVSEAQSSTHDRDAGKKPEGRKMEAQNSSRISLDDNSDAEARWQSVNWLLDELDTLKDQYSHLESKFHASKTEVDALKLSGMDGKSLGDQVS